MKKPICLFALTVAFGIGYNFGTPDPQEKETVERKKTLDLLERQWERINEENRKQVLWLARAIYSETKKRPEMVSIAWTVRNRVDTGYRGNTYKSVVLHHKQFSGLNKSNPHYEHHVGMSWEDRDSNTAWRNSLKVAIGVKQSLSYMRPFEKSVRHFYSPTATSAPNWAIGHKAVRLIREDHAKSNALENVRFAFYKGIN